MRYHSIDVVEKLHHQGLAVGGISGDAIFGLGLVALVHREANAEGNVAVATAFKLLQMRNVIANATRKEELFHKGIVNHLAHHVRVERIEHVGLALQIEHARPGGTLQLGNTGLGAGKSQQKEEQVVWFHGSGYWEG